MGGVEHASHRPGLLKQQNKSHKTGRHRSKSEIDKTNKGKVRETCSQVTFFNYVKTSRTSSSENFE